MAQIARTLRRRFRQRRSADIPVRASLRLRVCRAVSVSLTGSLKNPCFLRFLRFLLFLSERSRAWRLRSTAVYPPCRSSRRRLFSALFRAATPDTLLQVTQKERMHYQIESTRSEPIQTAVIRSRVRPKDLAQFVPAACGEVWSFIRSAGLPRPGRHLALYLDDQGTVEVGAEVSEPFVGNDRVHCSQLPAGRVVTTVHFGPYPHLSNAHAAIRAWCAEHRQRRSGISWELYGHWQEGWNTDSSQIRTDVFYLLQDPEGQRPGVDSATTFQFHSGVVGGPPLSAA